MKQLSLYEIIMLTHSSFQFNICTAHVNPPIDMFVRNANITMGRRVERTNSRTEKKSSQSLFKIEMYKPDISPSNLSKLYFVYLK